MKTRLGMRTLACLGLLAAVAAVRADEEKVPLDKVPPAVIKAVKDKFPAATLKQAEKEVEDGKTTYEIGLDDAGRNVDVSLKEDGTIIEVEKEIAVKDLPKAVVDGVKAKYPKATIKKAEEITKKGTTNFEVVITEGNRSRELVLDKTGKILDDEEEDED